MFAGVHGPGPKPGLIPLAAFLACLLCVSGLAQEGDKVRIGVYQSAPELYIDDAGRPAGFFVHLVESIAREQRWQIEYVTCNWPDCLGLLESGRIDIMPDVALTPDRQGRYAFHEIPVVQTWSQVYCLPRRGFKSLADLAGASVAVLEDSDQQAFLRKLDNEQQLLLELVPVKSLPEAFELTRNGRVDAAVANHFFGQRNAFGYGLVETPITFNQSSLFYAASDNSRPLLTSIDQALQRWKQIADSPYYRELNKAYAAPPIERWPDWLMPGLVTGIILFLALNIVLVFMRWRVRTASANLAQTTLHLERLLDKSPVIVFSLSYPRMEVDWISSNVERITGFTANEASQPGWWDRQAHPDDKARIQTRNAAIEPDQTLTDEYRLFTRDADAIVIREERRLIADERPGRIGTVIGSWSDVTAARSQARQVDFLSHHDRLTSLPNRARLEWLLEQSLLLAGKQRAACYVILVDLDRFKSINETLGVATGDRILKLVSARLLTWADEHDVVARVGNDEFCAVVLSGDQTGIDARLDDMLAEISTPTPVAGRDLLLTASIGVAMYPRDGTTADVLVQRAHLALQAASSQGGNRWIEYRPEIGAHPDTTPFLESDLRHAIQDESLTLFYQPQLSLSDNRLAGVEALVRWNHPDHGVLNPAAFIPMAEQTGLIDAMDLWVIRETCRQLAEWRSAGLSIARASANLSARELYNENLPQYVDDCLQEFDLPPLSLTLELTETMLMESPERARQVLDEIKSRGVRISMDDFGTGYSNLAYLTQLPIDEVKLDQSLVRELDHSSEVRTLLHGMIGLFERLGLELVAEGIETEAQRRFLIEAGCRIGQGFLLGKPAPAEALLRPTTA